MAVIFHNPGVLDIRAVTTFGLSVKETDNPIGFFGTGLKYAIAICLRHGCEIELFAGLDRFTFKTQADQFRGQEYAAIYMDGDDADNMALPFTLHLGANWELWQAYRELYCNALDEGGGVCDHHEHVGKGVDGHTIVVVTGDAFAHIHETRNKFINTEIPIASAKGVGVVETRGVYLRGIKISDAIFRPVMFGYVFQEKIGLTEDRTLHDAFGAEVRIKNAVTAMENLPVIDAILCAPEDTFEHQIDWSTAIPSTIGGAFKLVLADLAVNRPDKISEAAKKLAKKLAPEDDYYTHTVELSPVQRQAFERASTFLSGRGIAIAEYETVFVKTLGQGYLGEAKNGKIYISVQCFEFGVKTLVATLFEEYIHLSRRFVDCTREMQNHLFHMIVTLWEEMAGEPL